MVLLNSTRTVTTTIPHQTEPGLLYTCTSQANRINCITQLSSSHPRIAACGRFCAAFHCVTPQTALRRGRRGGETPILGSLSTRGCLLSLWLCGGCAVHSAVLVLVLVRNQVLAVLRARAVHMHLDTGAVRCLRKHSVRNVTRWGRLCCIAWWHRSILLPKDTTVCCPNVLHTLPPSRLPCLHRRIPPSPVQGPLFTSAGFSCGLRGRTSSL